MQRTTQFLCITFTFLCFLGFLFTPMALASDLIQGAQIFEGHCAGCHIHGGNIVRRGKTLKQAALKKNGYDSIATIAELVRNGKNNMSAYGDRLSAAQIEAVSAYVLTQAERGWR